MLKGLILGIIQGLTEFLPVSSSGHLAIFFKLFGIQNPPLSFVISVHLGSLLALIIYFYKDIRFFISKFFEGISSLIKSREAFFSQNSKNEDFKLVLLIVLSIIPSAIIGIIFKSKIETVFSSLKLVGVSFLFTSFLLFSTRFFYPQKGLYNIKILDSLFIGLAQVLAILPGVSRSGATISFGIFRGIKQEDSARFSFYMAILTIFGAGLIEAKDIFSIPFDMSFFVTGFFASLVSSLIAIIFLMKVAKKGKFHYFGFYTLFLAIISFFI